VAIIRSQAVDTGRDDYAAILDTIFPRQVYGASYAFVLRREPSFERESQLVVKVLDKGTVNAELMTVIGRSAHDTLSRRREPDRALSIPELAKSIQVDRRAVDVTRAVANRWQSSLFDAVRTSLQELEQSARTYNDTGSVTVNVVADGVLYRLWYYQPPQNLAWNFDQRAPLGRWAETVMQEVAKQPRGN
jgi:hypothetical protein